MVKSGDDKDESDEDEVKSGWDAIESDDDDEMNEGDADIDDVNVNDIDMEVESGDEETIDTAALDSDHEDTSEEGKYYQCGTSDFEYMIVDEVAIHWLSWGRVQTRRTRTRTTGSP